MSAADAPVADSRPPGRHRLAGLLWRRPFVRIGALLAGPIGWLGIVYLGSLAMLLSQAACRCEVCQPSIAAA